MKGFYLNNKEIHKYHLYLLIYVVLVYQINTVLWEGSPMYNLNSEPHNLEFKELTPCLSNECFTRKLEMQTKTSIFQSFVTFLKFGPFGDVLDLFDLYGDVPSHSLQLTFGSHSFVIRVNLEL